jgi:TRAP-type uncharacterized transport system substrate-binding protein
VKPTRRQLLRTGITARLASASWRDIGAVGIPSLLVLATVAWIGAKSVRFAPPGTIRFVSGPEGSSYRTLAERYKKLIEAHGIKVEVIGSRGSLDNLDQLSNPKVHVDVGLVQGGLLPDGVVVPHLFSLGSVFAQPLMVYARSTEPIEMLPQLKGKRLAVGPEGSGARVLALKILEANEMGTPPTTIVNLGGEEAARALIAGDIDAAFLMGDSATPKVMHSLRTVAGIELASFRQADGYLRKFRFLSKLTLPEGSMDLARDYPPRTIELIGPTVELVARDDLHPALSDLLIRAAQEIHGGAGLFRTAGEFPAPLARDFPISRDAERYYRSGEPFLYKRLPFWLASFIDRLWVLIFPLLVVIVPATKVVPAIYRWRVRSRIYRWYGVLMQIERQMAVNRTAEARAEILERIDEIAVAVSELKTPASFADQLYVLRDHVAMVRRRVQSASAAATA